MGHTNSSVPQVALALDGDQILHLLADQALVRRWSRLPLAFTLLGIERLDRTVTSARPDPSAVAAHLAGRSSAGRLLVAAAPTRDHPYNLARRMVSLAHLARGRTGVLVGLADVGAPPGPAAAPVWGGAGTGSGAQETPETLRDVLQALRALETSWPWESVLSDRASGVLVRSDQIRRVDLDGAFAVAGPLTAPAAPTGPSVLAQWGLDPRTGHRLTDEPGTVQSSSVVDVTVGPDGADFPVLALPGPDRVAALAPAGGSVLVRAHGPVSDLLEAAERALLGGGWACPDPSLTLRQALGLPTVTTDPASGRAAFPVPRPLRPVASDAARVSAPVSAL